MAGALLVLFLVVPLIELAVIVQVGQAIGTIPTLGLLVLMSVAGAWLMKREGVGVLRRAQRQVREGRVPSREVADGFLIVLGGALMLTPGFASDLVGMALLLPPVRAVVRPVLLRRLQVMALGATLGPAAGRRRPGGRSGVIDV
jgi:UPF0716 protein FxsA